MDTTGFICRTLPGFSHQDVSFFNTLKYHKRSIAYLYHFGLVLREILQYIGNDIIADIVVEDDPRQTPDQQTGEKTEREDVGETECSTETSAPESGVVENEETDGTGLRSEVVGKDVGGVSARGKEAQGIYGREDKGHAKKTGQVDENGSTELEGKNSNAATGKGPELSCTPLESTK